MVWLGGSLLVIDVVTTIIILKIRRDRKRTRLLAQQHGLVFIPGNGWQKDTKDIMVYHVPPREM